MNGNIEQQPGATRVKLDELRAPAPDSPFPSDSTALSGKLPGAQRLEDSSFNWITGKKIGIGNFLAARDVVLIQQEGIKSIFSLTDDLITVRPHELGVDKIIVRPIFDGAGNRPEVFSHLADELVKLAREHSPVLVCCHAGRSRSVALVAAYLVKTEGYNADVALRIIQRERQTKVNPELRKLLAKVRPR